MTTLPAPAGVCVTAYTTAFFRAPRRLFYRGQGGVLHVPMLVFLIEGHGRRYLVDGGVHLGLLERLGRRLRLLYAPTAWQPLAWLKTAGLSAADLDGVLMTHLDLDHVGALPDLADVPLHVTAENWQVAQAPPLKWRLVRFPRRVMRRIRVTHPQALSGQLELGGQPLPALDVTGRGWLWAVALPGHCPGHTGYLVIGAAGRLLLCGDAAYSQHDLETNAICRFGRLVAWHRGEVDATLDRLHGLRQTDPELRIVPSHDADVGLEAEQGPVRLLS